jgi:hypothetical protein
MATPLEWLENIAPNLVVDSAIKNSFISMSKDETDASLFESVDKYNMAVAYLAAHFLSLSKKSGDSKGVVVMEKEGDLQISYSNPRNSEGIMNTTQYLDSYNSIMQSRVPLFYMRNDNKSC